MPIDEDEVYESLACDSLLVSSAMLAPTVDESFDRVGRIMAVLDFRDAAQASCDRGGESSRALRWFAWHLGMMADFAAELRAVEAM